MAQNLYSAYLDEAKTSQEANNIGLYLNKFYHWKWEIENSQTHKSFIKVLLLNIKKYSICFSYMNALDHCNNSKR